MVRFEDDKIIVEISGYGNPMETWSDIIVGLIDVLGALDRDMIGVEEIRSTTWLLKALMPDLEGIQK